MLTIYAPLQRAHRHPYVISHGVYKNSFEVPERVDVILEAIQDAALGPIVAPDDVGLEPIRAVHDAGMLTFLESAYAQHQANQDEPGPVVFPAFFPPAGQCRRPESFQGQKGFYCVDMEVPIGDNTWEVALASARCAWTGAQRLRGGESCVYALCRPPGHHAGPDFMGGYCYLNNAAIAAESLRSQGGKVAILDIDYHHGNGTQAVFYAVPEVWYGSVHIDPNIAYPFFAGYADEVGTGAGQGSNVNSPLPHGTDQAQYLRALDTLLEALMDFDPRWLVVSAGFDTYIHDPIGTFQITTAGYCDIGQRINALRKPTLVVQEGGYHVPDLGLNVVALLNGVMHG